MCDMVAIKSISPASGGEGESKRAAFLRSVLESWGLRPRTYEYTDRQGAKRTNLVVKYGGSARTIWIIAHMDTVAEGDLSLWKTDPFNAFVKGGRIFGRGTSDNGQSLVASMYALMALKTKRADLKYNFGLALVADEELGSKYGIQKLLAEGIFGKNDMFVVPDAGNSRGDELEVAEKSMLWLKVTVHGKQVHASTPDKGVNAYRHAIRFLGKIDDELHRKYSKSNRMFDPPISTFEMTKHEKNVDSINIIPGSEVSYIDCRVLPEYDITRILAHVKKISSRKEFDKVKFTFETPIYEKAAPPTRPDAEIVKLLESRIYTLRGIKAKPIGIGGGTCAAFFRRKGYDAVCWSTGDDVAHQPNEYCIIKNMVNDSKVFASLFI